MQSVILMDSDSSGVACVCIVQISFHDFDEMVNDAAVILVLLPLVLWYPENL